MGHPIFEQLLAILPFPLRGKVGMGHPIFEQLLAILPFPLRGKVGMGVVQNT
jgi:hypothetical protein